MATNAESAWSWGLVQRAGLWTLLAALEVAACACGDRRQASSAAASGDDSPSDASPVEIPPPDPGGQSGGEGGWGCADEPAVAALSFDPEREFDKLAQQREVELAWVWGPDADDALNLPMTLRVLKKRVGRPVLDCGGYVEATVRVEVQWPGSPRLSIHGDARLWGVERAQVMVVADSTLAQYLPEGAVLPPAADAPKEFRMRIAFAPEGSSGTLQVVVPPVAALPLSLGCPIAAWPNTAVCSGAVRYDGDLGADPRMDALRMRLRGLEGQRRWGWFDGTETTLTIELGALNGPLCVPGPSHGVVSVGVPLRLSTRDGRLDVELETRVSTWWDGDGGWSGRVDLHSSELRPAAPGLGQTQGAFAREAFVFLSFDAELTEHDVKGDLVIAAYTLDTDVAGAAVRRAGLVPNCFGAIEGRNLGGTFGFD